MDKGSMCLLILATFLTWIIVEYVRKMLYWKRQNVETINIFNIMRMTRRTHLYQVMQEIYREMCSERKPFKVIETLCVTAVIVQDLDTIKDVLTTHYESFPDRGFYVNPRDPLLLNIFRVDYELWKPLRRKLTSIFTPAKVRSMFPTVAQVSENLLEVLGNLVAHHNGIVEMHGLCAGYAIDVIGNVAFGLECHSLSEPNTPFRIHGDKGVREHFRPFFDQFAGKYSKLMQLLNVKYHSQDTTEFFTNLVRNTVEYREKHNIRRHDFMDLMIQMKNDGESQTELAFSVDLMVGQAFAFFVAGFESTSNALTEILYELAKNQGVQEKARSEVKAALVKYDHKLTYDSLREMPYLKKILLEILRMYPIAHTLARVCRQPCTLHSSLGSLNILADTTVIVPVHAVHHNPEFYPQPEIFRPERFDEHEVAQRPAYTFLAFGEGPKICIAENFSKMEIVLGLAALLSRFRFAACEKTPRELIFDRQRMLHMGLKNDVYLRVEVL